jgi:hypothetical protein
MKVWSVGAGYVKDLGDFYKHPRGCFGANGWFR